MDEEDMDLHMLIKQFLSKDAEFRNSNFDPAPYLIQILKDKSADHEAMIEKQSQLIDQQNRARQIVEQICTEHSADFMKFLQVPKVFAQNLQKLKSNISIVKKKVKQTKALLLNTQKDIQQIHLNCMFNKKVYKQLKSIQVRLQQYETAYLALKNNQYYLCALNLPFVQGMSILESTLASRAETLRLRMISKAIDQLNNFLFFSPKVVLLSSSVSIERVNDKNYKNNIMGQLIANWDQQETFFKRYKLFKKALCTDYLSKIWTFTDLERKQGKLGLMHDIIKGIIRIGKINEITSSIQIYGPKQISNTFLLLKCFKLKQKTQLQIQQPKQKNFRWFVDRCIQDKEDRNFISAVMNIIGVLFRKAIIIHKIYQEFQQKDFQLSSKLIYQFVIDQLRKLIELLYFPNSKGAEQAIDENNEQHLNLELKSRLTDARNYINYGHSGDLIEKSLKFIEKNVSQIEQKQFENKNAFPDIIQQSQKMCGQFKNLFYKIYERDFLLSLEQIFCSEAQSFVTDSFETIISSKPFKNDEISYMKGYRSDDRKAIKEYIYLLSFMKSLEEYFMVNNLDKCKLYKSLLMCLIFFYLKLNYHLISHLIPAGELLVIEQQRRSDRKVKKKEEEVKRIYYKVLTEIQVTEEKSEKSLSKEETKMVNNPTSFHTTEKLKIIQRQNQMLLNFSCQFFTFVEEEKNGDGVKDFVKLIGKLQPANYEDQTRAKISRVWDVLNESEKALKQSIVAVLWKIINAYCIIMVKIYRQTGSL